MVSKCPSQMSGPWSGFSGLDGFVGRGGGGGGAPVLVPVAKVSGEREARQGFQFAVRRPPNTL